MWKKRRRRAGGEEEEEEEAAEAKMCLVSPALEPSPLLPYFCSLSDQPPCFRYPTVPASEAECL